MTRVTEVMLLGALRVTVDGQPVPVARPKQRALLAILALDAGRCVSSERLADAIWGARPPESVRHSLQVHVSSLRKLLGSAAIETCPGGYRLAVPREAVDALRAEDLLAEGRAAEAVSLFRGRPLEDVELETQEAARLDDLRAAALERDHEDRLQAGAGADLVPRLERLVAEFPLRERPRAQLMRALYRAGRQAEALAVFQETRRLFVDELGIEPSAPLRDLERAILQQQADLAAPPVLPLATAPPRARRWRLLAVAAVAALAVAGGVGAAYLLPPSEPHAAQRVTHDARPVAPVVATPVVHRKRTPRKQHPAGTTTNARTVHSRPSGRHHRAARRPAPAPSTTQALPATTAPVPPRPAPAATTSPRVATHPVATTTAAPPPAPPTTTAMPPAGPVRIVDTFDTPVVDGSTWNVFFNGKGADAVQEDGHLRLTIAPGATPGGPWNFVGAQYGTKACFSGDIDMQVDYRLVDWPLGSGAYVQLAAIFANAMVERFAPHGDTHDVFASMIDPRFVQDDAAGTTGSLRLTRRDGVVTTYYLAGGQWQQLDSAVAPNPAHLHIGLNLTPDTASSGAVTVILDNFSATAYGPTSC